ncbi:MAG TPA: high-potential iron-sulfur protein [Alphaproteobacteria bacterium]|nr:high-potential iron-sulfur protein [Alphaproteobacteria bacterium]
MVDETKAGGEKISRRALLRSVPIAAGIAASFKLVAIPDAAVAQANKLTHEAAKYQDKPNNGQACSTCLQFEPPNACKIVASPISPQGWCQFYAKKG